MKYNVQQRNKMHAKRMVPGLNLKMFQIQTVNVYLITNEVYEYTLI